MAAVPVAVKILKALRGHAKRRSVKPNLINSGKIGLKA
tara:strand:+ start:301 stop:414 length:114 start_codon:yes stop_codon:yes gene_type:complete